MGKLLYEVKGGGQGQAIAKSEISAAADAILQPLMDLLDGRFRNRVTRLDEFPPIETFLTLDNFMKFIFINLPI
jgi:hypothetical protein